ncbi:MAG: GNAT family N-acetyltransferase [Aquabacterium sp.]
MRPLVLPDGITLEPQTAAHAGAMFHVLSDAALYALEGEPPASEAWLRDRFTRLESRASADGSEAWLNWVIRLDDGTLAGYVQATVYRAADTGLADIAYVLASRHWGAGLATRAVQAMIDALVADHGVTRLRAVLKARNSRSLRLLQRLGFQPLDAQALSTADIEPDEIALQRVAHVV